MSIFHSEQAIECGTRMVGVTLVGVTLVGVSLAAGSPVDIAAGRGLDK